MNQHPVVTWRKSLGLTQQQAADLVGISRRQLSDIENGVFPRESTIDKILKFAGDALKRSDFAWRPEESSAA